MSSPTKDSASTSSKPRKKRVPVDPNETPGQRFTRLAEMRVGTALKSINGIASLGNKSQYEYDDSAIEKIDQAVKASLQVAVDSLKRGTPAKSAFKL
jgi:hypothetical protein